MGNTQVERTSKDEAEIIKSLRTTFSNNMIMNKTEKINSRINTFNSNYVNDTKIFNSNFKRNITLDEEKLNEVGEKLLDKLFCIAINNEINISLPQSVLVPDTSTINQNSYEEYFKTTQSNLKICMNGINSTDGNTLYDLKNQSRKNSIYDKLILKQRNVENSKNIASPLMTDIKRKATSVSPFKNSRLDESYSSKSSNISKGSLFKYFDKFKRGRKYSPSTNSKSADKVNLSEDNINKRNEIYSKIGATKTNTNMQIIKYFEKYVKSQLGERITEAGSKLEHDNEDNSKNGKNKTTKTPFKVDLSKSVLNKNNKLNKSTLSKSKKSKVPQINYKLDLSKLIEMYKKKKK